jgi:hypothetical protein
MEKRPMIRWPNGATPPFGCRWCGTPRHHHGRSYLRGRDVHGWEQPMQGQILARMLARRTARLNSESTLYHAVTGWSADMTGESADPYCADCKTDGCRQWMRTQDRLDRRRMELAGINPKRRSKKGGWGGGAPW